MTTGELAGRLGVAPTTIRSWGRRYGLEPAAHTPGGHRRWSPADVARLERMRALTSTGLAPAEAALLVRGGPAEAPRFARRAAAETAHPEEGAATGAVAAGAAEAAPPLPVGPDGPVGPVGPGADGPDHVDGLDRPDPADRGDRPSTAGRPHRGDRPSTAGRPDGPDRPGGLDHLPDGPLTGPGAPTAERPDLVRAALRLDSAAMDAILRAALASHGVVGAWDQVITPALRAVGRLWETSGERYIDIEHALTWHVSGALGRCVPRGADRRGAATVLACMPGEDHTLPLQALAAALAERRLPVRMLGGALPAEPLVAAVRRTGPAAVGLWSQSVATVSRALAAQVAAMEWGVRGARRRPAVLLLGPGWTGRTVPGAHHPPGLAEAADLCASLGRE
ncbi:MerR family transcriptional regulator [Streptomyces zhihengii]|uniref:MerR family transcriptional regulator n=1 Tax=Streptomyces zhihengii TaxID=1818004 RepID=A0ABS2UJ81_9ACTN|nr:MerR family transcriptional regulator [Streptomyces zhihengii]